MFPNPLPQTPNSRFPLNRFPKVRPISRQDTAAQFPQRQTFPNGTYASTAAIGATGKFGAGLPLRKPVPDTTVTRPVAPNLLTANSFTSGLQFSNPNPVGIGEGYAGSSNFRGVARQPVLPTFQPPVNAPTINGTLVPFETLRSSATATQLSPPVDSVFTGDPINNPNDAAWINYWNDQAAHPQAPAPRVMTKDQIWNVKAEQRRRKIRQNRESAAAQQAATAQPSYQPFYTQAGSLRIANG